MAIILEEDSTPFPDPSMALNEPNGLLAVGGELSIDRLIQAYRLGIFPWYEEEPILWWCPDPRAVLFLANHHLSKSTHKALNKRNFQLKVDENFAGVIQACAAPRFKKDHLEAGTWLTAAMQAVYLKLFALGYAHSVEVYQNNYLIGGIYGVAMGRIFFGESMFSRKTNASKIALYYLVALLKNKGFEFIDCQVWSDHLATLGATQIPRSEFLTKLQYNNMFDNKLERWYYIGGLI